MRDLDVTASEILGKEDDEDKFGEISRLDGKEPEIEAVLTAFDNRSEDEEET